MRTLSRKAANMKPYGQSLVETAIFLPILILLMSGVAEVANLLVTQNRVSTAARVATGFGASHYSQDFDWSQQDPVTNRPVWAQEMGETALNNVTETLDLDSQRWDIWTVTGTLSVDPSTGQTSFGVWGPEHAYGDNQVVSMAEWNALESGVRQDILAALEDNGIVSSDGVGVIATVAYHDRNSLLGLNSFNFGPLTRVRGLNVMRINKNIDNSFASGSCVLIPVAINYQQFSLYPTNWYEDDPDNMQRVLNPGYAADPFNLYPAEDDLASPQKKFEDPDRGLVYEYLPYTVPNPTVFNNTTNFKANVPGVPMQDADLNDPNHGYLYRARLTEGEGGFAWLDWDGESASQTDLAYSLTPPGDYPEAYRNSSYDVDRGDGDGLLEKGEWVNGNTGNITSNNVLEQLWTEYVMTGKIVLMVVFNETNDLGGANKDFKVEGFAKTRLLGFNFGGTPETRFIVFEFLSWANDCNVTS